MNTKIRKVSLEDLSVLRKVTMETWLNTYVNNKISRKDILSHFKTKPLQSWEKIPPNFIYYVATIDNKIVGLILLIKKLVKLYYLKQLYVLPKFQNRGIGQGLLDKVLEKVEIGSKIFFDVSLDNKGAIAFYRKNGFKKTRKISKFVITHNKSLDIIGFYKKT
jgi:ribosomal protein S18 acetylase RimI-like enzyme